MNSVVLAGGSLYLFKRVTAVPSDGPDSFSFASVVSAGLFARRSLSKEGFPPLCFEMHCASFTLADVHFAWFHSLALFQNLVSCLLRQHYKTL